MKKIINLSAALFISLLAAVALSCDKEHHDDPDGPDSDIDVTFYTGGLYEELGIKEDMAAQLSATGDFTITDTLLVYNQEGALVGKYGLESRSYKVKELELEDVPDGTYTLVLWQSAFRISDGARAWKVEEENLLSTVHIAPNSLSFAYTWALGTASATVKIGPKSSKIDLTPKAVGSILDVTMDNIPEDEGYTNMAMTGGRNPKGVYLDSSHQGGRWIEDDFSGVLFRLYPEHAGKRKFFTLVHGEDIELFILGDKVGSNEVFSTCPNKTVAAGKNYTFYFDLARVNWQPAYFGSAEGFAAWKADRYAGIMAIDPCLDWGSNLAHVEEYVQNKNWWYYDNDALYQSGSRWCKAYWVAEELKEQYQFETQDGNNLVLVITYCDDVTVPVQAAHNLLKAKGYTYEGEVYYAEDPNAYSYYVSADKSSQATINTTLFTNWAIGYQPYSEEDNEMVMQSVDLGLSVRWGARNLGANKPEEIGDFFAWGEVEPHYSSLNPLTWKEGKETGYDWTAYSMCDGTATGFTKYFHPDYDGQGTCHWAGEGEPDKKMSLDPEDDAAHVILGGAWRMPTLEEVVELADTKNNENYKWEHKSLNGQDGMSVTYLVNGNSIFLPNTGTWNGLSYSITDPEVIDIYRQGYYWTSTMPKAGPFYGYCLVAGESSIKRTASYRREGLAIRPVIDYAVEE